MRSHLLSLFITTALTCSGGALGEQQTFKSPDLAVDALVQACKKDDLKALLAIFGPNAEEIISSGDEVADRAARATFVQWTTEAKRLVNQPDGSVFVHVGTEDWPFPIPMVKQGEE